MGWDRSRLWLGLLNAWWCSFLVVAGPRTVAPGPGAGDVCSVGGGSRQLAMLVGGPRQDLVRRLARLGWQGQRAGGDGGGEVGLERRGVGLAVVGDDSHGLQRDDLILGQPPLPEPGGLGVVQRQGTAPVQEAVMEAGGLILVRRQQQELLPLRGVLGQRGVHQGVPAPTDRQAGQLGGPGADGLRGNAAALEAAGERRALGPADEVRHVRGLLEQGGPDGLEGGLGADQGEEPEARGGRVAGEGVGGGGESKVGRRRVTPCYRSTFPSAPFRTGRAAFTASGSPVSLQAVVSGQCWHFQKSADFWVCAPKGEGLPACREGDVHDLTGSQVDRGGRA